MLYTGLIFFVNDTVTLSELDQIRTAIDAVIAQGQGVLNYPTFNAASYNATFESAASKDITSMDPLLSTSAWKAKAFEFCSVPDTGTCTVMVTRSTGLGIGKY